MLRKLVLGLSAAASLGVAALGIGAVTATPAEAQWGGDGYYGRPHYGYGRPHYGYGRPHYGYGGGYYGPRCFSRPVRYWDGWGWVVRERRICR